jgi:hypothetical protein
MKQITVISQICGLSLSLIFLAIGLLGQFLSPSFARANDCELMLVSTVTSNKTLLDRISLAPKELSDLEKTLPVEQQPGGQLRFKERELSRDPKSALLEFIAMIGANRQKTFSVKDFDRGGPADTGSFTLGFPLVGKYSVEATYTGDYRVNPQFNLSGLKLIPPFGKAIGISNNPLTVEGQINTRVFLDLTAFPELAKYDIQTAIPATIHMDALIKVESAKFQLNLIEKAEMRKIAESNGYLKLRAMMLHRYVKAKMIEYHVKGIFKRWVALVSAPIILVVGYMILPDGIVASVREMWANPDPFEAEKALNEFAAASGVPEPIRFQISTLRDEVMHVIDPTGAKSRELTKKQGLNLDSSARFDVTKSQSVWIQHTFDKDQGKNVTLLYMSRFNGTNRVDITAVEVDPARYQPLIKFVESRGDFLAFSRSELKQ